MQTFKQLQDKMLRLLDEAGDTTSTLALVKDALNSANRARSGEERYPFLLWPQSETLTTVAGQSLYTLHSEFYRPYWFWNAAQNDWVRLEGAQNVEAAGDPLATASYALRMRFAGRSEVLTQPTTAQALAVASNQGADNGLRTVTIMGDTIDGVRTETITCGSSGSVAFSKILHVGKGDGWTGTLTLAAGAQTLLKLFPEELGRSYQTVRFVPTPTVAETITYLFYRKPTTMTLDADRPDIPDPFEDLLVFDALLDLAAYNQYDPGTIKHWTMRRDSINLTLQQAYDDKSIAAMPEYTTYIPREES